MGGTVRAFREFWEYRRVAGITAITGIFLVLLAKLFLSDNRGLSFLYIYGILVTLVVWLTFLVTLLRYRDPWAEALRSSQNVGSGPLFVSCMVAVRNEEAHIARCLDSMLRQTYPHKEVIVVNDASTDCTLAILKAYAARGDIVLIDLPVNVGKKAALTEAMKAAKGQIFAHTDSDSVWAPDAIEKIVKVFEVDQTVGAVSGHGRAINAGKNLLTRVQDAWMEGQFGIRKAFESVYGSVTCVSGPLAVFRKEAVYNYLPAWTGDKFLGQEFRFATDRTLTGIVLGGEALGEKLFAKYMHHDFPFEPAWSAANWKVLYCRSARSWTIVPDTFPKFLKQQVRWKKSFIRNTFFTGAFYWKRPWPVAAIYYLHVLFVAMAPFISFRHLVYLPANGNPMSAVLYLAGIAFIGLMFGLTSRVEGGQGRLMLYRSLMGLLSTLVMSWLVFYAAVTIRRMTWYRG